MRIMKLTLNNYKRVFLNDITNISYTPMADTQIILGQNGSGKSSLLEQLTPLPANLKKDFNDNGYKEIVIKHNDQEYVLRSDNKNKHSFLLENNELNDGNTISVQNKLVEYHFGITNHIQQILLGKTQFTTMSPSERKRWITELSTIDYSYSITVYNSLRQRHRDIVGGIKLLQANIVRVKSSALPEDLINTLQSDKQHITNLVDHLLTLINRSSPTDSLDGKIDILNKLVARICVVKDSITDTPLETLNNELELVKTKRAAISLQNTSLYRELDQLDKCVVLGSKDKLVAELKTIDTSIKNILDSNNFSTITDIATVYSYLNDNYTDIIGELSKLSEHNELDISRTNIKKCEDIKTISETIIYNDTRAINKLEEKIQNLKDHFSHEHSVTCPVCTHNWTPTFEAGTHDGLVCRLDQLKVNLTKANQDLVIVNLELEHIQIVRDIVTSFLNRLSYSTDTKMLLEYITASSNYVDNKHGALFSMFESVYREVVALYPIVELREARTGITDKLAEIDNIDARNEHYIVSTRNTLQQHIKDCKLSITNLDNTISKLTSEVKRKEQYMVGLDIVKSKVKDIYATKNLLVVSKRNEYLKAGISELRKMLLDIDNKLSTHTEYETLLTTYQSELNDLNYREKLLKITIDTLSPSGGLIAKSINSFLNCFIADINEVIASIWGYPMEILDCDLGDNDLDYKFKVLVNNDEVIEDISKTSSSMQEVINLVFKVVFCKYKGFIGYPLILDEFGRTFDHGHRITAYEALERTISSDFSQVYMVSHFESMYGRFGNADISILGTAGVEMNTIDSYNQVMCIT